MNILSSLRRYWLLLAFVMGCAGASRSCSSCNATNFGADWVVVQMDCAGRPFRCWTLRNTSISNEQNSDGIYWEEDQGNLVHISNNYNRVQVVGGRWSAAYAELGLTEAACRAIRDRQPGDVPLPSSGAARSSPAEDPFVAPAPEFPAHPSDPPPTHLR